MCIYLSLCDHNVIELSVVQNIPAVMDGDHVPFWRSFLFSVSLELLWRHVIALTHHPGVPFSHLLFALPLLIPRFLGCIT